MFVGEMNDASEVLHALYGALEDVGLKHITSESFGIEVSCWLCCA